VQKLGNFCAWPGYCFLREPPSSQHRSTCSISLRGSKGVPEDQSAGAPRWSDDVARTFGGIASKVARGRRRVDDVPAASHRPGKVGEVRTRHRLEHPVVLQVSRRAQQPVGSLHEQQARGPVSAGQACTMAGESPYECPTTWSGTWPIRSMMRSMRRLARHGSGITRSYVDETKHGHGTRYAAAHCALETAALPKRLHRTR